MSESYAQRVLSEGRRISSFLVTKDQKLRFLRLNIRCVVFVFIAIKYFPTRGVCLIHTETEILFGTSKWQKIHINAICGEILW